MIDQTDKGWFPLRREEGCSLLLLYNIVTIGSKQTRRTPPLTLPRGIGATDREGQRQIADGFVILYSGSEAY